MRKSITKFTADDFFLLEYICTKNPSILNLLRLNYGLQLHCKYCLNVTKKSRKIVKMSKCERWSTNKQNSSQNFDFIAVPSKTENIIKTKLCQFSLNRFTMINLPLLVLIRSADEWFWKFDMHCDSCDFDVDDDFFLRFVSFKSKFK